MTAGGATAAKAYCHQWQGKEPAAQANKLQGPLIQKTLVAPVALLPHLRGRRCFQVLCT